MNQYYNSPLTIILATLVLLWVCSTVRDVNAGKGKGKVPIYMPIPIPIPMPIGPSNGGNYKYHHEQFQHQHKDDEGEVKKIYLLQPLPKILPQPQLKGGGYMGPVQTNHIHMPSPIVHKSHQPRPISYENNEHISGGNYPQHETNLELPTRTTSAISSKSGHSELKVLPIVVIPPIAPMPPIQIPPSNNGHAPRMTFTPQFNNYVVSGNEPIDRRHSYTGMIQDHKTLSDYGGSGGGLRYKEVYGSLSKSRLRNRQARQQQQDYGGQSTRMRSRSFDDNEDDYDLNSSSAAWRRSINHGARSSGSGRWAPQMRRRAYNNENGRLRSNSIRDILEQQSLFDDEPSSQIDFHGHEQKEPSANSKTDCCNNENNRRIRHFVNIPHENKNSDQREMISASADIADKDYVDQREKISATGYNSPKSTQQSESSIMDSRDELPADYRDSRTKQDLSLVYYDRDLSLIDQQPRSVSKVREISASNYNPTTSRRLYLDEREILDDDDEWRFDSIKSVSHASPNTNVTKIVTSANVTITNQTTTKPPNMLQKLA